jgi:hypothetical protein
MLEIERGSNRSHCVENWLWKRLWACHETDCGMDESYFAKKSQSSWTNFCCSRNLRKYITDSMQQDISWCVTEFSRVLWTNSVHFLVHNSPPMDPALRHMNSVHSQKLFR